MKAVLETPAIQLKFTQIQMHRFMWNTTIHQKEHARFAVHLKTVSANILMVILSALTEISV